MTYEEYEKFVDLDFSDHPTVDIEELKDQSGRTLLYGYTSDRDDFHVYIQHHMLIIYIYDFEGEKIFADYGIRPARSFSINKRLYPECCDYEFCSLLKKKGMYLSFNVFREDRPKRLYYGKVIR